MTKMIDRRIEKMSVLELSQLVKALEESWRERSGAHDDGGACRRGAAVAAAAEAVEEQTSST